MHSNILNLSDKLKCLECQSTLLAVNEYNIKCNSCGHIYPYKNSIINFDDKLEEQDFISSTQPKLFKNQKLYEFINFTLLGLLKRTDIDIDNNIRGKEVLDIGCGPKPYFYNPHVTSFHVGIDISIPFLIRSSEILPESHFIKASAINLPFKDNSFDVILYLFTLHHIPYDHSLLIKEAYRVSREKIIVFDHNQSQKGIKKILKANWWKFKDKGFKYNTQNEWEELLKEYKIEEKRLLGGFLENIFEFVIVKKG